MPAFAAEPDWQYIYGRGEEALANQNLVEAEQHFNLALSYARKDKNATEIEQSQTKLADVLTLRNKTAQAQALYQQILNGLDKKPESSKQKASVLMSLGSIQEAAGDHTAAINYYHRALKITQSNYGVYSPAFAGTLHALGRANSRLGNKTIAAGQYKQAISILMKDPSLKAGEELQAVMHDYSDLLSKDADPDKSLLQDFNKEILNSKDTTLKPSDRALAEGKKSDKQSNPVEAPTPTVKPADESYFQLHGSTDAATSHQNQLNKDSDVVMRGLSKPYSDASLAPSYRILNQSIADNNRSEMGQDYYERMTAVDLKALGADHPSVGNDLYGLAQYYIRQKQYDKAQPLIKRAYAIYQNAYGQDNLLTISACASQAFVEYRLGNLDRAIDLYRSSLAHSQSTLGPNNFETAKILNELAYLYFHQGKLQESRTFYKWAIASTEASVGNDSPLLAACLQDYASVLNSLGESAEANVALQRANTILDFKKAVSVR
ncbi:MAG: tetratricopeptide repeat protein [Candidatus Obscuribacterales bacterium]|nr:tetratricopeptide repeat protein [Candidatus Obscuribacterales bacterium]